MIKPQIPIDEDKRLLALKEYSILDTLPEKEYDDITYLASQICGTPISLISLIDDKRQWFKSHHGLDATETPKEIAFCAHAINDKNNIFIINDSRKDERFHDNPLVTDDPYVIFYAGVPLISSDGYPLGTLCVIDNKPNKLDDSQLKALQALTNQLMNLFELRKKSIELQTKIFEIETQNKGLEQFARIAAHDIKSPLNSIIMMSEFFEMSYGEQLDAEGLDFLKLISNSSAKLVELIDGILQYSKNARLLSENKEDINIKSIVEELIPLVDPKNEVKINFTNEDDSLVYTNKIAIKQIFINLLTNAVKYNDKEEILLTVAIENINEFVKVNVIDNGQGIKEEDIEKAFKIFEVLSNADRYGEKGNGIGLATVKSLVEGLGGTITLKSEVGKGSNFEFTIKK
ncbi:MAG: GAF domain-containing sensor histidine kinase [Bacteroidota bacterium]